MKFHFLRMGRGYGKSFAIAAARRETERAAKDAEMAEAAEKIKKERTTLESPEKMFKCPRCSGEFGTRLLPSHFKRKRARFSYCRGSGTEGSETVEPPLTSWEKFEVVLARMRLLKKDWNSYGAEPPNASAIEIARSLGTRLFAANLTPSRVVPIAPGGVAIYVFRNGRIVDIEVDNQGGVICSIGKSGLRIFQIRSDGELGGAMEEMLHYFENGVDELENSK